MEDKNTLVLAPLAYAPVLPEVNAASATNITDGGGNSLTESGSRVHELYAQQVTGANGLGISRYRDFTLAEKEIANMRFHEQGKNVEALNLLNLVQNRVDINGTVNAIRGNKIDGGLYFLSSNGIAIGPQGVINGGYPPQAGLRSFLATSPAPCQASRLYHFP